MKTKIFTYKNHLGIDMGEKPEDVEGLINDPTADGELGTVLRTDAIEITKDAKEMIRAAKREAGSFAPIMLTKHAEEAVEKHGKSSFSVMGYGKVAISREQVLIGSSCDVSVLDDMIEVEEEAPEEFRQFVDSIEA